MQITFWTVLIIRRLIGTLSRLQSPTLHTLCPCLSPTPPPPVARQPLRCGLEHQLQRSAQLPDQLMAAMATLTTLASPGERRLTSTGTALCPPLTPILWTLHPPRPSLSATSAPRNDGRGQEKTKIKNINEGSSQNVGRKRPHIWINSRFVAG